MKETFAQEKLVKTPGISLHRQLYSMLREQIMRGIYLPGALLPNEDELCGYFGVSKITVRRALSDLREQGLVDRQQGKGTFVSTNLPTVAPFNAITFLEAIKQRAQETQAKVLDIRMAVPPGIVALQMQIQSSEQAVYAARLRHVENVPLMVTEAWVPNTLRKVVTVARLKRMPLYQIILDQGIEFGRVIEEITAMSATPYLAKHLQVDVGVPLLRVTRLIYDRQDRPVEHLTIHANPERSRVLLNLPSSEFQQSAASRIVHDYSTT